MASDRPDARGQLQDRPGQGVWQPRGVRIVVAPDSFKGTMSARTVARALAGGIRDAGGDAIEVPLADGGEGTAHVLQGQLGGDMVEAMVTGPLGDRVEGRFLWNSDTATAVVETASATGLNLMRPTPANAWNATSAGTGELLVAAAKMGAKRIFLGVGGSACTDGGVGAMDAIRSSGGLRSVRLKVLCDVTTSFADSARVFSPQKGADPDMVELLTERLEAAARSMRKDPRAVPRSGAAGGLSGALWAEFDADLVSGIDAILDLLQFDSVVRGADAVVTGEGQLDAQSAQGKVIDGVTRRAALANVPVTAVVGRNRATAHEITRLGLDAVFEAGDAPALALLGQTLVRRAL